MGVESSSSGAKSLEFATFKDEFATHPWFPFLLKGFNNRSLPGMVLCLVLGAVLGIV